MFESVATPLELSTFTHGQLSSKYGMQIELEKQKEKKRKQDELLLKQYGERMSGWDVVDGKKVYVGYSEEYKASKGKQRPLYEIGGKCNCETCCNGGCCHPTMLCACSKKSLPPQFYAVDERRKTPKESIPTGQSWMLTLPVLVLAVVLIGGIK